MNLSEKVGKLGRGLQRVGVDKTPEHRTFRNIPEHEKIKIIFMKKKIK